MGRRRHLALIVEGNLSASLPANVQENTRVVARIVEASLFSACTARESLAVFNAMDQNSVEKDVSGKAKQNQDV